MFTHESASLSTKGMITGALIVLFMLFIAAGPLFGQDFFSNGRPPRFGTIDRTEGLISLSISSVQQDKYGFMWFGSQGGLNRYDGKSINHLRHDPFNNQSLPNDLVQTIHYDVNSDTLWVGTYNGLSRYDFETEHFTTYQYKEQEPTSLSNNIVIAIAVDSQERVWAGTMEGLNVLSDESGSFRRVKTAHATIRALFSDSSDRMWIGSYGGLQYWDCKTEQIITPDIDLPSPYVMDIEEPEPGRLLLGLWDGGLMEYWPETGKTKLYELPDNRIYTVLESSDGTKWAGSWGGGLWAKPAHGDPVWFQGPQESELGNSIVYSLFEDEAGLVWVGTNGGGVHYLSPRRRNYRVAYHELNNPNSINEGKIEAIYKDENDDLWLGIYGSGLNRIDAETGEVTKYKPDSEDPSSISNDIVNSIYEDSNGNFWVGTNVGLNRYDRKTGIFETWSEDIHPEHLLSNRIIYWVTEDNDGRLWIGTYGEGIDRYDPDKDELVNFKHKENDTGSLSNNIVYRILQASNGSLWVATNNGLNRFVSDEEGFVRYFHDSDDPTTLSANNIRALMEDSQGRLWIGAYSGGLNRYDPYKDQFVHYTTKNGLASNNVLSILEGGDGRIWIATRAGINIIDPKTDQVQLLDERDGLFGVFFNMGHYKDEDGTLYFGGSHGVTKIDSIKNFTNPHPPAVHITNVSVFEEPLEHSAPVFDGGELTFDYSDNFLSFEFVALDYEAPRHNKYAYMMEGFDKDWIQADTRSYASYTNLPPGSYTFRVRASNNDGVWNDEGASLDIRVSAPWYRQAWAFILYALAAAGLLLISWRLRTVQLVRTQNEELAHTNKLLERANADLERLSIHDSLTGLFNRRYFESSYNEEWQRARRGQHPLGLLMIDIDHFKHFNDTHGHIAGDRALELVALALQKAVPRSTDFVARYGGEEFVAVLFQTDLEGACRVADHIHKRTREIYVPLNGQQEEQTDTDNTGLSVSIGVHAGIPHDALEPEDFLRSADTALYLAKKAGRNTTRTSEDVDEKLK